MTHTEKVHVLFGALAALVGALALWSVWHRDSIARLMWPVIAFLIGFCLFAPVEAQTRTYQVTTWWQTVLSLVPQHFNTWPRDWLHYLPQRHIIQHKIGGLCIMTLGLIEFLRARGRLAGTVGRWALPILMMGAAVALGVHGGTAEHLNHHSEQVQHHVFGLALAAAAVSLALVRTGRVHGLGWEALWAALVFAIGLEITFSYRLTPAERLMGGPHHESADSRLR